jgi:hypothetical protein
VWTAQQYAFDIAYEAYQTRTVYCWINKMAPDEYQRLLDDALKRVKRTYPTMLPAQIEDLAAKLVRDELKKSGTVPMVSFAEFTQPNCSVIIPDLPGQLLPEGLVFQAAQSHASKDDQ